MNTTKSTKIYDFFKNGLYYNEGKQDDEPRKIFISQGGNKGVVIVNINKTIRVKANWDEEAQVWVATSDDVSGLATEAETLEQLIKKLQIIIPELLYVNGLINEDEQGEIPFHLLSERTETIKFGA